MRFLNTLYLLLALVICSNSGLIAQDYLMDGTPINSCSGFFFDPGGSEDYEPEIDVNVVICADLNNSHILLQFHEIDLAEGEELTFRDGDNETAPLIDLPVDVHSGMPFGVQASATNLSGCLYVTFRSDEDNEAAGWRATISCLPACQPIDAQITTEPSSTAQDGSLNICLGDTVVFSGQVTFPQNGHVYNQSLATSVLHWQVGIETHVATQQVSKVFTEPGIYAVRFDVTDRVGCPTANPPTRTIRVSPGIEAVGENLEDNTYCWGEEIVFYTSPDSLLLFPGYTLLPDSLVDYNGSSVADTILLPDGSGGVYQSTVLVSQFPVGAMISENNPFEGIWVMLEHSYSGDLDIELICPNGQQVFLLDYPSGLGSTNFGEPFSSNPVDGQSFDPTPGIPYRYAFTENAENGRLTDFDPMAPTYTYTTVSSTSTGLSYTYTDTYFPAGAYRPDESFTEFQGCPFNGEWTLRVTDNLGLDNGTMFGWGIGAESPTLSESVVLSPVDWNWTSDDHISSQNQDSVVVDPQATGLLDLQLNVVDNLGCISTTTHTINILPINHPDCLEENTEPTAPVGRNNFTPMPFTDQLSFNIQEECLRCQMVIFNVNGQQMGQYELQHGNNIDTSNWPAGFYFYQLRDEQGLLLNSGQLIKVR